jgi:GNAT superfamily N-acetyltransferase
MAAAWEDDRLAGCVRVTRPDATTAELGLLAVARDATGRGVATALVRFAEAVSRDRGATRMRLELLVPRAGTHPAKVRLHAWYSRLGYRVADREDFADAYPDASLWLAVPCDLLGYEKPL